MTTLRTIHPALQKKLTDFAARMAELEASAQDAAVVSDPQQSRKLFQELGSLRKLVELRDRSAALLRQIEDNRELVEAGDQELAELAEAELPELERAYEEAVDEIETRLLVSDEHGDRNAILEIRAGTGGDEAALFARDLARMYERFCERQGWKMQAMHLQQSEHGGFKEAIFEVSGDAVFRLLRFEMGGHRVQRVPVTESQGRVHTSAATVAVLPEAEEVDLEIDEKDLEIQATTSSGPGGQHVNKTQSAVRITHVPSGLVVFCQEERSQHKNKARAMQLLRARLFDLEQARLEAERARTRKTQVGSGDRSQRIRTYNWPQNRVTDHRVGENYSLEKIVDGDLLPLFDALLRSERDQRLSEL